MNGSLKVMNQAEIANRIKEAYRTSAAEYRRSDELDVTGKDHQRICEILGMLSGSFGRPVAVLDAGCGTGRYFHCLKNTRRLVGLDVSSEMLQEARHPVKEEEISVAEIELVCGNVHTQSFPEQSFDFIYSIGVFGNGCGLSTELLSKFRQWLTPGGRVFFDVFDSSDVPRFFRIRKKISNYVHTFPILNSRNWFRKKRPQSLPFYYYFKDEIVRLLESCGFFAVAVYPQECPTPAGRGKKLQCLAVKSDHPKLPEKLMRNDKTNGTS
jgi:ubiquinone/menaquinone biosynthesis C-methylase UbiE